MSLHIIRLEQGVAQNPAQSNQNPSIAESPTVSKGQSPVGNSIRTAAFIQAAQQVRDTTISNIGFATGNYEAQEQAEALVAVIGIGVGFAKAPIATGTALLIKTASDVYVNRKTQERNQFKQSQEQLLTGKISVNSSRW